LLDLLTAKKMVLIDTAGMAQRDTRTKELLEMISHRSVQRLLVVNAASQGETIEDVLVAYRATSCAGSAAWRLDAAEMNLVFATAPAAAGSALGA
jgi:flagellar biosynthesis protein FlhF